MAIHVSVKAWLGKSFFFFFMEVLDGGDKLHLALEF